MYILVIILFLQKTRTLQLDFSLLYFITIAFIDISKICCYFSAKLININYYYYFVVVFIQKHNIKFVKKKNVKMANRSNIYNYFRIPISADISFYLFLLIVFSTSATISLGWLIDVQLANFIINTLLFRIDDLSKIDRFRSECLFSTFIINNNNSSLLFLVCCFQARLYGK